MTENARNELIDKADRDQARLKLDYNVVVEAGAGTGKTTLLTDRALFALLGKGIKITELVALTFTDKAAGEIRVRLTERLQDVARSQELLKDLRTHFGVEPEDAQYRARQALEDMDKAVIGTLHSFAAQLLRAYPIEARVDPGFQVDKGDLRDELFASEWAAWLDVELGENAPREQQWIDLLSLVELEELQALAKELCEPRVRLDDLRTTLSDSKKWLEETAKVLEGEPARQPAARGKIAEKMAEVAAQLRRLASAKRPELPQRLAHRKIGSATWPASWDPAHEGLWELAHKVAEKCSPESEAVAARAVELLAPFAENFRRAYSWRGWVSFDGMLIAARNLLRDFPGVREELKNRFRALLIDEFQDTDPLQGELIMYLAEARGRSAKDWRQLALEPGRLFIVGDPKQSIYRFRGADLSAYENFVDLMRRQDPPALICDLKTNFRSEDQIIEPVNFFFGKMMLAHAGSQPPYKSIHARPGSRRAGSIEMVTIGPSLKSPDEEPLAAETRQTEAEWIARWIEDHCRASQGDRPIPSDKHRFKDVAILLRTTTPLAAYLEVLKDRGIPYVVEGEKYFYGTQEVQDFLNLLRCIDDPSDRKALVGVLRSPLIGLTDAEIYALSVERCLDYLREPKPAVVEEATLKRLKAFFATLRRLEGLAGRAPLAELLARIVHETALLELASSAYHGQQTLSNLLKFGRLAAESSDGQGTSLKGFIGRALEFIATAREEGESPLADEEFDAVRILTIHKSKGLEYPVVILPNLSGATGGQDPDRVKIHDSGALGVNLSGAGPTISLLRMQDAESAREDHELVRLLYVAMTRARTKLILIGAGAPTRRSFASALTAIGAWAHAGAGVPAMEVPAGSKFLDSYSRLLTAPVKTTIDLGRWAQAWSARQEKAARAAEYPRSTTPSGAMRAFKSSFVPEDPGPTVKDATLLGSLVHKVLQSWDFQDGGDDSHRAVLAASKALAWANPEADWKELRDEAEAILNGFLKTNIVRLLKKSDILAREVPFAFVRGSERGKQLVRGMIDLLYCHEGELFVADYKTDRTAVDEIVKQAKRYRPQAELYVEAVKRTLGVKKASFQLLYLRQGKAVEV